MKDRLAWAIATAPTHPFMWSHDHAGTPVQILIEASKLALRHDCAIGRYDNEADTFTLRGGRLHAQYEIGDEDDEIMLSDRVSSMLFSPSELMLLGKFACERQSRYS